MEEAHMPTAPLEMPQDRALEIYYDRGGLGVRFRERASEEKAISADRKVLRVALHWLGQFLDERFFEPGSEVTVGPDRRNALFFPTRDLPPRHALIRYECDGTLCLNLNEHFSGIVQENGLLAPIEGSITLRVGSRGWLEHGAMALYFETVDAPEPAPKARLREMFRDPRMKRWLTLSTTLHAIALVGMLLVRPEPEPSMVALGPALPPVYTFRPNVIFQSQVRFGTSLPEGGGQKAAGPEGERRHRKNHLASLKNGGALGILRMLSPESAMAFAILDQNDLSDVDRRIGSRERFGLEKEGLPGDGRGLRGHGPGGGGRTGSVGIGMGEIGRGPGRVGLGVGPGPKGKSETPVYASIDEEVVVITGTLSREQILKSIQDHIGLIRYCYERRLQIEPQLKGKVVADFVIGMEGLVTNSRIKSSSMGSPTVEDCIRETVWKIPFPKPEGGTVEVVFPFVFRVAG